jgi:hypothetical protein
LKSSLGFPSKKQIKRKNILLFLFCKNQLGYRLQFLRVKLTEGFESGFPFPIFNECYIAGRAPLEIATFN